MVINTITLIYIFFIISILSVIISNGIRRILISNFFIEKTGYQTFYWIKDKKKTIDGINIIYIFSMAITYLIGGYYLSILSDGYIFFNAICLWSIFLIYALIGITLRLNYHYYIDEERDIRKRVYESNYVLFGSTTATITSFLLTLFVVLGLLINKDTFSLVIFIWFLMLNVSIFPDYLNKIWFKEIRTTEGIFLYYGFEMVVVLFSIVLISI